jgi:hypothetical protein
LAVAVAVVAVAVVVVAVVAAAVGEVHEAAGAVAGARAVLEMVQLSKQRALMLPSCSMTIAAAMLSQSRPNSRLRALPP